MNKIHDLSAMDSGDAYDETQRNDEIKDGDILILKDGAVAILMGAWPVLTRGKAEVFYVLEEGLSMATIDDGKYAEAAQIADSIEEAAVSRATQLFDVMDGIIDSEYSSDILADVKQVSDYASDGCDTDINDDEARRIIAVGNWWLNEREQGNGEWSRIRSEAKEMLDAEPVYLMHPVSGDVELRDSWLTEMPGWEEGDEDDERNFKSRKAQYDSLIEVRKDENGDWVEV